VYPVRLVTSKLNESRDHCPVSGAHGNEEIDLTAQRPFFAPVTGRGYNLLGSCAMNGPFKSQGLHQMTSVCRG